MSSAWRPNRLDADGVTVHRDVAHAADYNDATMLRRWNVGNGTIRLELVRSATPGTMRRARLVADYEDEGVAVQEVVMCSDELEEAKATARLEAKIMTASARPIVSPIPASRPDRVPAG